MTKARPATAADLDAIVHMGQALHMESPRYRAMRFDSAKVRELVTQLMQSDVGAVFVVEDQQKLVGVAVVVSGERWFGPDRYVTDLAVYLRPESRGNGGFFVLVQAIEEWAREQGVQEIDVGVSTDIEAARAVRAYQRLGYTLSATSVMTKSLSDVHRS